MTKRRCVYYRDVEGRHRPPNFVSVDTNIISEMLHNGDHLRKISAFNRFKNAFQIDYIYDHRQDDPDLVATLLPNPSMKVPLEYLDVEYPIDSDREWFVIVHVVYDERTLEIPNRVIYHEGNNNAKIEMIPAKAYAVLSLNQLETIRNYTSNDFKFAGKRNNRRVSNVVEIIVKIKLFEFATYPSTQLYLVRPRLSEYGNVLVCHINDAPAFRFNYDDVICSGPVPKNYHPNKLYFAYINDEYDYPDNGKYFMRCEYIEATHPSKETLKRVLDGKMKFPGTFLGPALDSESKILLIPNIRVGNNFPMIAVNPYVLPYELSRYTAKYEVTLDDGTIFIEDVQIQDPVLCSMFDALIEHGSYVSLKDYIEMMEK